MVSRRNDAPPYLRCTPVLHRLSKLPQRHTDAYIAIHGISFCRLLSAFVGVKYRRLACIDRFLRAQVYTIDVLAPFSAARNETGSDRSSPRARASPPSTNP